MIQVHKKRKHNKLWKRRRSSSFDSEEFKELSKQWDKKLEENEFKDAEFTDSTGFRNLREPTVILTEDIINLSAKELYYQMVSEKAETYAFNDPADKMIMSLAAEGKFNTEIRARLENMGFKIHGMTIMYKKRRFEHLWKIRSWTMKQMNLKENPQKKRVIKVRST
jgi:hypothetical protein